ncbi:MAG: hypothetical protein ORN28_00830 [Rhodoferax sp.]|nr:hypothetical protein [Rhodoferax sp.]
MPIYRPTWQFQRRVKYAFSSQPAWRKSRSLPANWSGGHRV